jgi:hypothetical protein
MIEETELPEPKSGEVRVKVLVTRKQWGQIFIIDKRRRFSNERENLVD